LTGSIKTKTPTNFLRQTLIALLWSAVCTTVCGVPTSLVQPSARRGAQPSPTRPASYLSGCARLATTYAELRPVRLAYRPGAHAPPSPSVRRTANPESESPCSLIHKLELEPARSPRPLLILFEMTSASKVIPSPYPPSLRPASRLGKTTDRIKIKLSLARAANLHFRSPTLPPQIYRVSFVIEHMGSICAQQLNLAGLQELVMHGPKPRDLEFWSHVR
jgi:hypothetical protein